jgi:hypothetical protein
VEGANGAAAIPVWSRSGAPMLSFGSAGGAAEQPKTVQPPFSSKQSA